MKSAVQRFRMVLLCAVLWAFCFVGVAQGFKRDVSKLGVPLRWYRFPVSFVLDQNGIGQHFKNFPDYGAPGSEEQALLNSFQTWLNATCDGKAVGFSAQYGGRAVGKSIGFNRDNASQNTNLIVFRNAKGDWKHDNLRVAVTTTTYNNSSGELLDADMEINAADPTLYFFATKVVPNSQKKWWDLQTVITHEAGHFLGLGHSDLAKAVMYTQGTERSIEKRKLHADDSAGICAIYPPKDALSGIPTYNQTSGGRDLGCNAIYTSRSLHALYIGLIGLFLFLLFRRKRVNR